MTDGKNYDTSLWQLRRLGPRDLIVPLTCCVQNSDSISYLDPKPINETICQELSPEHYVSFRHRQVNMKIFTNDYPKSIYRRISHNFI